MTHKVKVSGSRPLRKGSKQNSKGSRKGSRKNSRRNSKKHNGLDFTAILNDMPQNNQQNMGMQGMPGMMPGMPGMMPGMEGMMPGMPGMMPGMPGMMPGMDMNMDMSNQMMMGRDSDPLHLQNLVPQKQSFNINNYGLSYDQLSNGVQENSLANTFNGRGNNAQEVARSASSQVGQSVAPAVASVAQQVAQPVAQPVAQVAQEQFNRKYYRL